MLGWLTARARGVVARGDHRLAALVHDQRAKGVAAAITRVARSLNCLPQKDQILFGYLFHCLCLRLRGEKNVE
jgi:hypothetical protein